MLIIDYHEQDLSEKQTTIKELIVLMPTQERGKRA